MRGLSTMAEEQDKGYRLLFSFPFMVERLIRLCFDDAWIARLDFSTLEKASERDLSPELLRREKDIIWRLRFNPESEPSTAPSESDGCEEPGKPAWFYLMLHLEFQSSQQYDMPLRIGTHQMLVLADLRRHNYRTPSGKIPPVLSVVLYNGRRPWTGPTSVSDLIEPFPDAPEGMDLLSFRLIDEQRFLASAKEAESNPVAGLFRLEQCQNIADLVSEAERAALALPGDQHQALREALAEWLIQAIVPKIAPGAKLPPIMDLTEVPSMLEQRAVEWTKEWEQEGRKEGHKEGRKEGRKEGHEEGIRDGEAGALLRLLAQKYGALPQAVRDQVASADRRKIRRWMDRLLTEQTLAGVFLDA